MIPIWSPYDFEAGMYVEEFNNQLIFSDEPMSIFPDEESIVGYTAKLRRKYNNNAITAAYQEFEECWYIADIATDLCFDQIPDVGITHSDRIRILYTDYDEASAHLEELTKAFPDMSLELRLYE